MIVDQIADKTYRVVEIDCTDGIGATADELKSAGIVADRTRPKVRPVTKLTARKAKRLTLAEAMAVSPNLRVELTPAFVVELAGMVELGADEWAACPTTVVSARRGNVTERKRRAKHALGLGLSVEQALALVPEADREATRRLCAEEAATARASCNYVHQYEADRLAS